MTRGAKSPGSARDRPRETAPGTWPLALWTPGIRRRAGPRAAARQTVILLFRGPKRKYRDPLPLRPQGKAKCQGWRMAERVRASRGSRGGGQAGPGRFESKARSDPQVMGRVGPLGPSSSPGSPPAVPAPRLPAPDAGHLPRSLDPALAPTRAQPQPCPLDGGPQAGLRPPQARIRSTPKGR